MQPTHSSPLVGLQLYTLRDESHRGLSELCRLTANMGYQAVELSTPEDMTALEMKTMLDGFSLQCAGLCYPWNSLEKAGGIASAVRYIREAGAHYAMLPGLPHRLRTDLDGWKQCAAQMQAWADAFAAEGIPLLYHFHGYEFTPVENSGETGESIIKNETDANTLFFQLDTFWALHGARDPLAFLQQYGERIRSIHCKDMNNLTDKRDVETGSGCVDFKRILPLARERGISWFLVEQEEYDRPPLEAAEIACRQLKALLAE